MKLRLYLQVHPDRESKRPYSSFFPPSEARVRVLKEEGYHLFYKDLYIPLTETEGRDLSEWSGSKDYDVYEQKG